MEVQDRRADIQLSGATVLIVAPSTPESVRGVQLPFEVLCDPDRIAYRYFGLERGGASMFFNPKVLGHYIRLIFSGWMPRRPETGEDLLQLGGDFVLSAERHLLFAHRSRDPADRPTVDVLIRHLSEPDSPPGAIP